MRVRNLLTVVAIAASGVVLSAAPAIADPPDPHMPDAQAGRCSGTKLPGHNPGYCDGEPYPDGTFWRWASSPGTLYCAIANSGPVPSLAPSGGCGGGWRG